MKKNYDEIAELKPVFDNCIPVVFATDANYLPYLAVTIQSLIDNSSSKNKYDIIILESDISKPLKNQVLEMNKNHKNISIRFYNIKETTSKYDLKNCSYYTDAIYYRIFMPYIMRQYDKMIYLDCDLVIETDIANLFSTDIKDNYLAAVRDIGMIIYKYNDSNLQYLPANYFNAALKDVNVDNYFNSGVLIMNLSKFRKDFELDFLIEQTNKKEFLYPDQDGLNNLCKDKTLLLNISWNTPPFNMGARSQDYIDRYLPKEIKEEYYEARKKPNIIHYNMLEKPWLHPCYIDNDLMVQFWKYATRCSFLKTLLYLPPNQFYKSKNRESIPYFEYAEILKKYCNCSKSVLEDKNEIYISADKYLLFKISDFTIKYETIDFFKDHAHITASFTIGIDEMQMISKIHFVDSNENKYICDVKPYGKGYSFDGKVIGQKYIISADVALSSLPTTLRLFIVINGKHYLVKHANYSNNFPLDRINKSQYFVYDKFILSCDNYKLKFEKATLGKRLKKEIRFDLSLFKRKGIKTKIAALIRIPIFIRRKLKRKPIWIIGCNYMAEDNGFAFFKYMQTQKKHVKTYFAVNDLNSEAAKKAKKVGKIVCKYSKRFSYLSLISDAAVSSIADLKLKRPIADTMLFRDIFSKRKFVFLQHGVISQDLSREHNRFIYNPDIFCTSAHMEYDEVCQDKYFYTNQVKITGLPRFDYLYNDNKNIITIMPTWRKYLNGDYGPTTNFYKFYYSLLHDKRLQNALKKYSFSLVFKPHPNIVRSTDLNIYKKTQNDKDFEISNRSYAQTYAESNIIVSDYSSAIFDFIYLGKPVIFTQPDADEFFSGKHVYDHGYIDYEKNGFGDVSHNLKETVDLIIECMENNCKMKPLYEKRVNNFFKFRDQKNSERIFIELCKVCDYKNILKSLHKKGVK